MLNSCDLRILVYYTAIMRWIFYWYIILNFPLYIIPNFPLYPWNKIFQYVYEIFHLSIYEIFQYTDSGLYIIPKVYFFVSYTRMVYYTDSVQICILYLYRCIIPDSIPLVYYTVGISKSGQSVYYTESYDCRIIYRKSWILVYYTMVYHTKTRKIRILYQTGNQNENGILYGNGQKKEEAFSRLMHQPE